MFGRTVKSIPRIVLLSVFFVLISSVHVGATEGGGTIYPGGNEDFMMGALPPPGFYFLNYFVYIHAGSYDDARIPQGSPGAGHKISSLTNGVAPDFRLDVVANTFRFVYVTPIKILGADFGMHAIVPVMNVDASMKLPGGASLFNESDAGIGDTTIDPFILGWHFGKSLHLTFGLDILTPTGQYNRTSAVNVGRNYFELEPVLALTYLHERGFEVSIKMMYDYNFKNMTTDYRSGQEFHFDYLLGQHYCDWMFGVGGQFYQQTTNDTFPGQPADFDGNKGQAFSIGPAVQYQYKNMFFNLKYQHDVIAENRSSCQKIWFKFMYAF